MGQILKKEGSGQPADNDDDDDYTDEAVQGSL